MLLDSSHRPWAIACLGITLVSGTYYAFYAARALNGPSGGSGPGLVFGGAAAAALLFAGLLGARKKVPTWQLGRARTWMRGHIWLGLLSLPLVLFHAGFQTGGVFTSALLVVFFVVFASGLVGLALQQFLPRMMTTNVPMETIYEEIDHVIDQLRAEADELVGAISGGPLFPEPEPVEAAVPAGAGAGAAAGAAAGAKHPPRKKKAGPAALEGSGKVKDFYLREMRPWLTGESLSDLRFATSARSEALFDRVKTLLPTPLHEALADLSTICEEKRQLDLQKRLHVWLHGWLLVHVPLAAALLVMVGVHAFVSLRYR